MCLVHFQLTIYKVLRTAFTQLYLQEVMLEGIILKPNMVITGLSCTKQATVDKVAGATIKCQLQAVPAAIDEFVAMLLSSKLKW